MTNPPTTPSDPDGEREAYEAWARTIPGEFFVPHISEAFAAGYRAALRSPPSPGDEIQRVIAACDRRIASYERKAASDDPLADDDCNRHERMKEHAEACRYLKAEMLAALSDGEVKA